MNIIKKLLQPSMDKMDKDDNYLYTKKINFPDSRNEVF